MRLDAGAVLKTRFAVEPHYVSLCFVEHAGRHPRRQTSFSKRLRRRARLLCRSAAPQLASQFLYRNSFVPVLRCCGVPVLRCCSVMAEEDFGPGPTAKADVTSKIVEFLSAALAPTADGNYTKTMTNILQAAYSEPGQQTAFRSKLQEWKIRLDLPGAQPHDPISHVPAGSVQEFYVAPWQCEGSAAKSSGDLVV